MEKKSKTKFYVMFALLKNREVQKKMSEVSLKSVSDQATNLLYNIRRKKSKSSDEAHKKMSNQGLCTDIALMQNHPIDSVSLIAKRSSLHYLVRAKSTTDLVKSQKIVENGLNILDMLDLTIVQKVAKTLTPKLSLEKITQRLLGIKEFRSKSSF